MNKTTFFSTSFIIENKKKFYDQILLYKKVNSF